MANTYVCYMSIFPELIFASRYPILIFSWSIVLCLSSSYIKNILYKPIIRSIDKRSSVVRNNQKAVG